MNSLVKHIFIMALALIVSGWLAAKIHRQQTEIVTEYSQVSKAPLAGLHKFASDVQWMRFINYCGSQKAINEENLPQIIDKLEELISLDPNFEKSYSVGVQMIAVESPKKAVELLKRACQVKKLEKNWRLPFFAAFVLTHHFDPPEYEQADEFLEMAIQRAGTPEPYLVNALIRTKANIALKKGKAFDGTPLNKDNIEKAKLYTLYQEWKKVEGSPFDDLQSNQIPDLRGRLLEAVKKAKMETTADPKLLETAEKIRKEVNRGQPIPNEYLTPEELKQRGDELNARVRAEQEKLIDDLLARLGAKIATDGKIDTERISADLVRRLDEKCAEREKAAIQRISEAEERAIERIRAADNKHPAGNAPK